MSDELDRLAENEQVILDKQIKHARTSATDRLPVTGRCHFCEEPIGEKKFCDEHCSKDWHDEQAARVRKFGAGKAGLEYGTQI